MAHLLRLKHLRERANLTQQDLAKLTGFAQGSISRWERGSQSPNVTQLRELAKRLKVSHVGELFDPIPQDHKNETERRAFSIIERLEPADLTLWLDAGERLARRGPGPNNGGRPRGGGRSRSAISRGAVRRSEGE